MSKQQYQKLIGEIGTLNDTVKATFDAADEDGGRALSAEEKQTVIDANKRIEELEHQAKDIADQLQMRGDADRRGERLNASAQGLGVGGYAGKDKKEQPRATNPGDLVLNSPEFKQWLGDHFGDGKYTSRQFGSSPRVNLPGGLKTLITGLSDTTGGALIRPIRCTRGRLGSTSAP